MGWIRGAPEEFDTDRAHLTAALRCGGYIDYGSRSSGDYGGVSRALDYVFQCVGIDGSRNRVVNCRVNCSHVIQEFAGLDGNRVRDINAVLVTYFERGCEEIAARIAEIDIVGHRDDWPLKLGAVDSHRLRDVAGLAAIEKYRCRISLVVSEATSLGDRLGKCDPPGSKGDLLLVAKCAERQVCLWLAVHIDNVTRMDVDVVSGFGNECPEG